MENANSRNVEESKLAQVNRITKIYLVMSVPCALSDSTRLDSRETFYAHLSHFQQFRLKNSSKQFMAGRKNQIKIHAQQRDSKTATFSIQRHHQRISTPKKRE